jgi:hypothetical protein
MDRNEALAITIQELLGEEPQKIIAERAGIPESVFSLYKRGRRYPKDGNKERLAQGLGVTIDQFNELEWENLKRLRGITAGEEGGDTVPSGGIRGGDTVPSGGIRGGDTVPSGGIRGGDTLASLPESNAASH